MDDENIGTLLPLAPLAISHFILADAYIASFAMFIALVPIYIFMRMESSKILTWSLAMLALASVSLLAFGWGMANKFALYSFFLLFAGSIGIVIESAMAMKK